MPKIHARPQLLEMIQTQARKIIEEDRQEHQPIVFIVGPDGDLHVVLLADLNETIKRNLNRFFQGLADAGSTLLAFISETWVVRTEPPKGVNSADGARTHGDALIQQYGSLQHVPGRKEALMICVASATGLTVATAEITSTEDQRTLGEWEILDNMEAAGSLSSRFFEGIRWPA